MLPELDDDYGDWKEVFKYASEPTPAGPTSDVSRKGFTREDVVAILYQAEGENDGDNWIMAGKLRDGRFFSLNAGCDYTGWG